MKAIPLFLSLTIAASVALAQEPPPPPPTPAETQPTKNPAEKPPEKTTPPVSPGQPQGGPLPTAEFLAQEMKRLGKTDAAGSGAPTENDWKVHWELHVLALPTKQALGLLSELRDETTIEAGWGKLQALVEKDEAEMVANNGGQMMPGFEIVSVQGEDLKYGIEFDTPFAIESVETKRLAADLESARNAGKPATEIAAPKPSSPAPIGFGATTFETRKLGIALKLNARVSEDGKQLEVMTKFDRSWLKQWDESEVGRLANNEKIVIKQPRIAEVNYEGTSGLYAGERILLNAHRVPVDTAKMELVFLRVWTTARKTPAVK